MHGCIYAVTVQSQLLAWAAWAPSQQQQAARAFLCHCQWPPLDPSLPAFPYLGVRPPPIQFSRPRARSARFVESLPGRAYLSPLTPLCSVHERVTELRHKPCEPRKPDGFSPGSEAMAARRLRHKLRGELLLADCCWHGEAAGTQMLMSKLSLGCQRSGGGSDPLESATRPSLANMMCAELRPST